MSDRRPRAFGQMRDDRLLAMARERFGRAFSSRTDAAHALSRLSIAEQHALRKPRAPLAPRPPTGFVGAAQTMVRNELRCGLDELSHAVPL